MALPLVPDEVTKRIAKEVHEIVNVPMDLKAAWRVIEQLTLDVLLFPDWQPFPDQSSLLLQTRRMAPVQVCFFVRGTSCSTLQDYERIGLI